MAKKELSPECLRVVQALTSHLEAAQIRIGCSGGADSLALSAGVAYLTRRTPALAGRVEVMIVDHGLQADSAQVAQRAADQVDRLGLPARICRVEVVRSCEGLEADARRARYGALTDGLDPNARLLIAHTMNDQAESVLLGLARGSGTRSLAGIAPVTQINDVQVHRPLLGLPRSITRQACQDWGLEIWDDPHNERTDFLRVAIRHQVLPRLAETFGADVVAALARTATLARIDADELDRQARQLNDPSVDDLEIGVVEKAPRALADRILRAWLIAHGVDQPSFNHVASVRELIDHWHGQKGIDLPGGIRVRRHARILTVETKDKERSR